MAKPEPRQPVSRDAEIAASDDDESDEFEPLDALLAPRAGPSTPSANRVNMTQFSTPDRRPESLFSSPLTIQPRVVRHFAMDDLLKDAKKDSSTQETYKRLQAARENGTGRPTNKRLEGDSLRTTLIDTVEDEHDNRLDKVVRAVERTESSAMKQGWYFFRPTMDDPVERNRYVFPARAVEDICGEESSVGSPQELSLRLLNFSLKLRKDTLPDELFLWMMDEVCVEKSALRRDEMCRIMCLHPSSSVRGQITPSYLEGLFMRLGASGDIRTFLGDGNKRLETTGVPREGHYQRHWGCLCSVLEVLEVLASSRKLEADGMYYCIQTVLAMSVDPELLHDSQVLLRCRKLLLAILSSFPSSQWDTAITVWVYSAFPYPPLRLRSLKFLPTSTEEMHDLRRRMATVFFFDDLSLAGRPPDSAFELRDIAVHLQSTRFKIRSDTDYASLRALLLLLDIAVGAGSIPDPDDPLLQSADAPAAAFDAEVDRITTTLAQMSRSINDTGMKSILPMEAKMVMDWVAKRLAHSVRTKPKPKISIYDLSDRPAVDVHLPQQQNLMKRFLQSRQGGSGEMTSV
ncbi:uncharacterized protein DNG_02875 [Cephalotrichum gorgonifer]|uniref:Uncharacterized protein n=1 Tax=Cephalotrichum gorgonifer TaxID=2041049 RepID=A0AAE8MV51_9PEZI|nr:uncharacterized protein DNG_02875 [Cephalotrichum gorgonifer]